MEAELYNQPFVADLYQIGGYSGRVLRYEYVGHDAAAAINGASQPGGVAQVFVELDTVFREELSMFVAGQPVHFAFGVFSAFVGALDATSGRGVVAGDSQADGRTVTEVDRLLHQTLTERATAYDGSPVVILNGACKDFAGRGRAFVHQYYERCLLATARTVGILFHTGIFTSLCIYDEFSFRKEFVYHTCGGFHVTAGIAAQVDDETLALLVTQLGYGIQQLHV